MVLNTGHARHLLDCLEVDYIWLFLLFIIEMSSMYSRGYMFKIYWKFVHAEQEMFFRARRPENVFRSKWNTKISSTV